MLRFTVVAVVAAIGAVGVAKTIDKLVPAQAPPASATVAMNVSAGGPQTPAETPSPASISKAADGHYWAEAEVDGHPIRFLVDTGATAVALTADDARRLGIDPASLNYSYSVATANGAARAAQVQLASIAVAGARVDNVQAFVLDRGLETSLLGMTYLGRLSEFQATPTALILRP
ncbi:MAG: TIGR02281 family clan AA aspartic protease [Caulobacteraceae bacterium]